MGIEIPPEIVAIWPIGGLVIVGLTIETKESLSHVACNTDDMVMNYDDDALELGTCQHKIRDLKKSFFGDTQK